MSKTHLAQIIGQERILDTQDVLDRYSHDMSFVHPIKPRCVVKPGTSQDVQAIVKWANETLTPLVPVSSGEPHFRGDTVPNVGGAVIVDLSGMKKVIRVDPRNRVAMVQPGVTFGELQTELAKAGLSAYLPLLPRSTKSVVGSMLEREPVTMPVHHWDCTDPMLCAEIIFGTGDVMRSGEAAGPDTIEEQWEIGKAQMCPFGLGQFNENRLISGAQGTIGIVTWATLKCRFASTLNQAFFVPSDKLGRLIDLAYKLMHKRLGDHCFILNGLNLSCLMGNDRNNIDLLSHKLPNWVLFVSFEGYGELPEEKVRYQEADFLELAHQIGLKPEPAIGLMSELLRGPSPEPYWKFRYKGACHDLFFLTTLDRASEFVNATSDLAKDSGFPVDHLGIYIQPVVQGTSCHCEFNLYCDPANRAETKAVQDIVTEKATDLANMGAFFSRPYGTWAYTAFNRVADTTVMERKVKNIFDPNGILNPGKLCF